MEPTVRWVHGATQSVGTLQGSAQDPPHAPIPAPAPPTKPDAPHTKATTLHCTPTTHCVMTGG